MNALIVCHAGAGVGLGHLTRCLVAARALDEEIGAKVHLLIQGDPVQRADLAAIQHCFVAPTEDLLAAMSLLVRQLDSQVVILDLHPRLVPAEIGGFLASYRQSRGKVVSIDGLVDQRSSLDLIFIPSFHWSPPDRSDGAAPILFGWDCFLLNVKRAGVDWKPGKRVLTLAGGSDATELGKTLPTLLDGALPDGTELHWVTGPYAKQPILPGSPRLSIVNHQAPTGLDDLMVDANYALTVYGVSFFELLYYGIPTVVFSPYGNKNDAELAAIAEAGVALVASDEREGAAKITKLMADDRLAGTISRRARQKLSTRGGRKLARAVASLTA